MIIEIEDFEDLYENNEYVDKGFEIYPYCRSEVYGYVGGDSALWVNNSESVYYFKYTEKTRYNGIIKRINKALKKENIDVKIQIKETI